ncbi:MAG TPA: fumarylacetoacetase, partial [Gemmatimonadaceae bacterium]|nr:fumarylacetoacetase [Gemmatimonadaceae bacterium]
MNETHDPGLLSWVESANDGETDFPIQNLPFGVFARSGRPPAVGVAIGDMILDVTECGRAGFLANSPALKSCAGSSLNPLMELDGKFLSEFRSELSTLLRADTVEGERASARSDRILVQSNDVSLQLPAKIGDYTDFYASVNHATNVGRMFRPDSPLLPNYKHVPIGYHGRASSIVASGAAVRRPWGQVKSGAADEPTFVPSGMLDYEAELGFYVRKGNPLGNPVTIDDAAGCIFGFCLVNDWSARDIQAWEYQPLGPFLAKNFATTVSPWIVTSEAAEPYRVPALRRPDSDPQPLDYLRSAADQERGGLSAVLEVYLSSERMRSEGMSPAQLSRASFEGMYWTVSQMLAHHASNGCNLRAGDLLASGTVSGETADSLGCLLELTRRGAAPLSLASGEERKFLLDGDEVIMRGFLEAPGRPRIGFG